MAFERPLTAPAAEDESRRTSPEEKEGQGENLAGLEEKKISERTASVLSPENRSFFSRMSEKGAKIADQVYEGLYKIPGVNRIVGKLEIAYNQFWIDRHQKKAIEIKSKIEDLNSKIGRLDQAREDIASAIGELKQENLPGIESLQLKLQDIERQRVSLLNDKDKAQSKFEARDNEIKLYTNERDRVADRFISRYAEKLRPMEAELGRLQTYKDQIDLQIAVAEAGHKEQLLRLGDIERIKNKVAEVLRGTGMSEKEIRDFGAIRQLEAALAAGRERIRAEKETLVQRRAEIDKRIAKVEAKANSYRDKEKKFVRIKEGRPVEIDVVAPPGGGKRRLSEGKMAKAGSETMFGAEQVLAGAKRESRSERGAEDEGRERLAVVAYLSGWNEFLKETYKNDAQLVEAKDFLKVTGLGEDYKLDAEDFKNILGKYLKYRKAPMDQFNRSIDKFFDRLVKNKG